MTAPHHLRAAVCLTTTALTAAALAVGPRPLAAQPRVLDVGSFTLSRDGQRLGREQFSVTAVQTPEGETLELRAESATGDVRGAVRLETDSAGTPIRYAVEEREGATIALRLGGQRVRGRFSTLARGRRGEAAREFRLLPGAVVLEQDGIIQHALLVLRRRPPQGTTVGIPTLTPLANRSGSATLTLDATDDTVTIAGARRPAWRWRLTSDTGEERLVWADPDGHILRLRIPARGVEALRDDLPR